MNKKKIILRLLIVIITTIIIITSLFIWITIKDLKEKEILKNEIISYSNKDLVKDNFYIEVKTQGDYAYIEEAVKKYYKDLSDNIKIINYYINDKDFANILSIQNIEEDRPNFLKSHITISKVKYNVNSAINNISNLCEEETIKNLIDKTKIDKYDYELFLNIMYTEQDIKQLNKAKIEMNNLSYNLNIMLNKIDEILNFLEINNSSWIYENGQIFFETENLANTYNNLYNDLTIIINRFNYNKNTNYTNNYLYSNQL